MPDNSGPNQDSEQPFVQIIDEAAGRDGGYFIMSNRMADKWLRVIGPSAFAVWCVFKSFCRGNDTFVFPRIRQKDWAEYIGISVRSFITTIDRLEHVGLLKIARPTGKGKILGNPSTYTLKIPPSNIPDTIKKDIIPLTDECRFVDPIHGSPLCKNCNSVDAKDASSNIKAQLFKSTVVTTSKEVGGPDGPASAPIQRKRHAPIVPLPKPLPKKRVFIQPGSAAAKVVSYWNKLQCPNPRYKLTKHTDMTTKKMQSVALYVGELMKGTFTNGNGKRWRDDFFEKNNVPDQFDEPIKLREITRLMTKYLDYFKEGYWPTNKDHLPRDLPGFLLSGFPEKTSYLLRTKFNPADEQSSEPKDYRPQYTDVFRRYGMLDGNGKMKDIYNGIAAIERRVLRDDLFNWDDIRIKARFGKPEEGGMVGLFEEYCEYVNREWNEWSAEDVWNQWGRCFKDWVRTVQQEMEM